MNILYATEVAFNNGCRKAVNDIFEKAKKTIENHEMDRLMRIIKCMPVDMMCDICKNHKNGVCCNAKYEFCEDEIYLCIVEDLVNENRPN